MEEQTLINGENMMSIDNNINNGGSVNNLQQQDRLSSLPEPLLTKILTHLPLHSAATTSVLSHRWRHRWTKVSRLILDSYHFHMSHSSHGYLKFAKFSATVNHILQQVTPPTIRTFFLRYPYPETEDEIEKWSSFFAIWIRQICSRNPEELMVTLQPPGEISPLLTLPACVFETLSLVKLELCGRFVCEFPDNTKNRGFVLPNLKTLELNSVHMSPDLMGKFVKCCPLLESLSLDLKWVENRLVMEISGANLKFLDVEMNGSSEHSKFLIDAPQLEDIRLHGCFAYYHFVNNQSTLIEANLGFHPTTIFQGKKDNLSCFSVLFGEISSAKVLHLWDNLDVLNCVNANVLKSFNYLTGLRLTYVSAFKGNPIPACLLAKLKWIEMDEINGSDNDLKLLKYILRKAEVLEEVFVKVSFMEVATDDETDQDLLWKEIEFCRKLFKLSRKSLTCEIQFSGDYIQSSSKHSQNGSIVCQVDSLNQYELLLQM
ncbi:hypothetical protein SOVF_143490 [Spinacia oleracea]|nr:hypothetical protein SOVF_143490 [Spinacia oleracea]